MSQQTFADFYENYLNAPQGEALRAQIDAVKDGDEFRATVVAAGHDNGFEFTEDDVVAVMRASESRMALEIAQAAGELSDEQLAAVAGGVGSFSASIPTVNIQRLPSFLDRGHLEFKTVMCPW